MGKLYPENTQRRPCANLRFQNGPEYLWWGNKARKGHTTFGWLGLKFHEGRSVNEGGLRELVIGLEEFVGPPCF